MEFVFAKKHLSWLNQYACMHYGAPYLKHNYSQFIPPENFDYVEKLAKFTIDAVDKSCSNKRALDVGCNVGGITFQLAKIFEEVLGVDCSKDCIDVCEELKKHGKHPIVAGAEGDLEIKLMAAIPESIERTRCNFMLGNAEALPDDIGKFGCVMVSNIIDRLQYPRKLLEKLPNLVADGGLCVVASPHCFLDAFTPKENWLGGYVDDDGNEIDCSTVVKEVMSQHMTLVKTTEIAFIVQYRTRNFETAIVDVQVWRK